MVESARAIVEAYDEDEEATEEQVEEASFIIVSIDF